MKEVGAEKVMPYDGDQRAKGEQVKEMFDNIAPAYDFMNRAMTLGIDKIWRRKAVNMIARHRKESGRGGYNILDVATGTGDLAISMVRKVDGARVIGVDLSDGMLEIGRKKVREAGLSDRVTLAQADCLELPFAEGEFDCISVAFGVRNFEHLAEGYKEILRVLRPGGMLCVIELSVPKSPVIKPFYKLYTRNIIPWAGRLASKDMSAYTYLPASIDAVPQRGEMTDIITAAGFTKASYHSLTMGVCTIYVAVK